MNCHIRGKLICLNIVYITHCNKCYSVAFKLVSVKIEKLVYGNSIRFFPSHAFSKLPEVSHSKFYLSELECFIIEALYHFSAFVQHVKVIYENIYYYRSAHRHTLVLNLYRRLISAFSDIASRLIYKSVKTSRSNRVHKLWKIHLVITSDYIRLFFYPVSLSVFFRDSKFEIDYFVKYIKSSKLTLALISKQSSVWSFFVTLIGKQSSVWSFSVTHFPPRTFQ